MVDPLYSSETSRRNRIREALKERTVQEGRNQVLYLLLCEGDENPDKSRFLFEVRKKIVERLESSSRPGGAPLHWPDKWPDFKKYSKGGD